MAASSVVTGAFVAWQSFTLSRTISSPFEQTVHQQQIVACRSFRSNATAYTNTWESLSESIKSLEKNRRERYFISLLAALAIAESQHGNALDKFASKSLNTKEEKAEIDTAALRYAIYWKDDLEKDNEMLLELQNKSAAQIGGKLARKRIQDITAHLLATESHLERMSFTEFIDSVQTFYIFSERYAGITNLSQIDFEARIFQKEPVSNSIGPFEPLNAKKLFVLNALEPEDLFLSFSNLEGRAKVLPGINFLDDVEFEKHKKTTRENKLIGASTVSDQIKTFADIRHQMSIDILELSKASSKKNSEILIEISGNFPYISSKSSLRTAYNPGRELAWVLKKCDSVISGKSPSLF